MANDTQKPKPAPAPQEPAEASPPKPPVFKDFAAI